MRRFSWDVAHGQLTYEPYLAPAKTVTLAYYKVTMTTPLQFQVRHTLLPRCHALAQLISPTLYCSGVIKATYTGPELVVPADAWIETSNIEHSIQH